MNPELKKLNSFATIFKNLQETEAAYIELEEFDVDYSCSEYFNANMSLSAEIESTVDFSKLTPSKQEKYNSVIEGVYTRLMWDYPRLYSIGNGIEDIFHEAYQAAEEAIALKLKPYEGEKRPFFACGYSSFRVSLPEYTLLGVMLKDDLFTLPNFTYSNGVIEICTSELNKKFSLTSQEYELYGDAYNACLAVLSERLKLTGHVEADIR